MIKWIEAKEETQNPDDGRIEMKAVREVKASKAEIDNFLRVAAEKRQKYDFKEK